MGVKRKDIGRGIYEYIIMIVAAFAALFPIIWVLVSSFKTNNEIMSSSFAPPASLHLGGYIEALGRVNIPARFMTSLLVASVSTLIGVAIYAMSAYVLARVTFKGRNLIFTLFISSMLIPGNALLQPIFLMINKIGLYDTKTGLILVYIGFGMPISLFLLRSCFLGIPKALEEAAIIDGAGFLRVFFSIMLPLARPALISSAILMFLGNWNELLYALMLTTSEENRTLPLTIKFFTTTFGFDYSAMLAAIVICVAPAVIIYILLQRQIMGSMVAGAVKG
ncbi:carbohydrate ABC transporter permease [Lachnospiraceae bacterium ZAX-1]